MTWASVMAALGGEMWDLGVGIFEARHTLFARVVLYGALAAALGVALAPLDRRGREWGLVGLSVASLALRGSLPVTAVALAFSLAFFGCIERVPGRAGTLAAGALALLLLAYPAFLPEAWFAGNTSHIREFWAFATNVWWLRCVAYLVDRRVRGLPPRTLREFLLATLFFPTFVNGPIETTEQMAAGRGPGPAVDSWADLRDWLRSSAPLLRRVLLGCLKVMIGGFYLGRANDLVFATGGAGVTVERLWLWVFELYFQFYLVFSGWTDVAVALGRLLGFAVMENFDRPWRARSVAEFWRRWHISFGVWLRNYVYIPLGGNRRHVALNVLAVFLASGLWHVWGALKVLGLGSYPPSAWMGFVLWGLANGLGVLAARWWNAGPRRSRLFSGIAAPVRLGAARVMAFIFVSIAWVPFFLPPWLGLGSCSEILWRLIFETSWRAARKLGVPL